MDDEQPRQELVKCVLVGDNAVGKTRLICARACNQEVSLSQLLTTHVPTVWAIDQYRIYKEVLENSWVTVDSVDVSLRLWDTFGDHHKDRRFAYGRSDVVLMCFDTGRVTSLENCRSMWYHQIRRFCPHTPIILVGCKNDTRFIYKDEQYLTYCKERSPLVRQVHEKDLVMPDQGRAAAREMGMPYFETSVLTFFGVNEVFENAIRAALCARRTQRFWMTNLKRVMKPFLQEPFCPPRPTLPDPAVSPSTYHGDLLSLYQDSMLCDVIFVCGSVGFSGHKFLLSAVSPLLHRIFTMDLSSDLSTRSSSETSLASSNFGSSAAFPEFNDETECLIKSENSTPCHSLRSSLAPGGGHRDSAKSLSSRTILRRSSFSGLSKEDVLLKPGVFRPLNHPAFQSLHIQHCQSLNADGKVVSSVQTVLTCTKLVSPQAMSQVIKFLYTGDIQDTIVHVGALRQAAEYLELAHLSHYLSNITNKEEFLNTDLAEKNLEKLGDQMSELGVSQGLFSDIIFKLDDGTHAAHKPLLMARCDMMQAMFSDDFIESSARVVKFPGVSRFAFQELLHFLYTDRAPKVTPANCLGLVELANRLVLPRLTTMLEKVVIDEMVKKMETGADVCEEALKLLQPCQVGWRIWAVYLIIVISIREGFKKKLKFSISGWLGSNPIFKLRQRSFYKSKCPSVRPSVRPSVHPWY
jgi:Rho-related BTB domain-containing protein 1/2